MLIFKFDTCRFFGGGTEDEEEKVVKGDDVIVELEASLEDLYMGGTMKVGIYSAIEISVDDLLFCLFPAHCMN